MMILASSKRQQWHQSPYLCIQVFVAFLTVICSFCNVQTQEEERKKKKREKISLLNEQACCEYGQAVEGRTSGFDQTKLLTA